MAGEVGPSHNSAPGDGCRRPTDYNRGWSAPHPPRRQGRSDNTIAKGARDMHRTQRQGISTIGIVVAIVVLIAGGLVTWYFVSDRFRTSVDSTMTDLTKWTPE